jgi:hypothetical protein
MADVCNIYFYVVCVWTIMGLKTSSNLSTHVFIVSGWMSDQPVETPSLPDHLLGVISSYSPGKAEKFFGDVARMVKKLQALGFNIPTPRLVFKETPGSGVKTVAESVIGLKLIPDHLCYPLEIRFVQVERNDVCCSLNFNGKRYTYPMDTDVCKKDIADRVKTILEATDVVEKKIIMTVESSLVPDLHVAVNSDEDMPSSDIGIVVIAANDIPSEDVLKTWRTCANQPIGVLTKIDLLDPPAVSMILIGNSLSLSFGLTGVAINEQLEPDWLVKHAFYSNLPPEFTGVEAVMKKVGLELTASIEEILKGMKGALDRKKTALRKRLGKLGEAIPTDEGERQRFLERLLKSYSESLKDMIQSYDFRTSYIAALNKFSLSCSKWKPTPRVVNEAREMLRRTGECSPELYDHLVSFQYTQRKHYCGEFVEDIISCLNRSIQRSLSLVFGQYPQIEGIYRDLSMAVIACKEKDVRGQVSDSITTALNFPCGTEVAMIYDLQEPPCYQCGRYRSDYMEYCCGGYQMEIPLYRITDKIMSLIIPCIRSIFKSLPDEIVNAINERSSDAVNESALLVEDPAITEERKAVVKQLATLEDVEKFVA